jgi:acyl carrier protein
MIKDITSEQIYSYFERILKDYLGEDIALSVGTDLREDFGVESLEFIEFSVKLEKAFDVKLPNAEIRRCVTPSDIVQLVLSAYGRQLDALRVST